MSVWGWVKDRADDAWDWAEDHTAVGGRDIFGGHNPIFNPEGSTFRDQPSWLRNAIGYLLADQLLGTTWRGVVLRAARLPRVGLPPPMAKFL